MHYVAFLAIFSVRATWAAVGVAACGTAGLSHPLGARLTSVVGVVGLWWEGTQRGARITLMLILALYIARLNGLTLHSGVFLRHVNFVYLNLWTLGIM